MSWELIAHELGHLYGVPEEGAAWVCDGGRCEARNYESPYSVMGHGSSDYNAHEKAVYGWLTNVTRVERAGELALAAIDRPSSDPQAVHVLARGDEYWLVLDGRRARRIPAVRSLGTLVVPTEPGLVLGRLAPGAHRVTVRAVDRAGNRGPAAVRRFRVPS